MVKQRTNPTQQNNALTSGTNSGSAGGVYSYINLGGLKILYGTTALCSVSGSGNVTALFGVNFPSGFFSSAPSMIPTVKVYTNTQYLTATVGNNTSSTSGALSLQQTNGANGGAIIDYIVIGV